jgi:hypothetical protein
MTDKPKEPAEKVRDIIELLLDFQHTVLWKVNNRPNMFTAIVAGATIECVYEPGVSGIEPSYYFCIRDHNGASVTGDGLTISRGQPDYELLQSLYHHARKCAGDNSRTLDRILEELTK